MKGARVSCRGGRSFSFEAGHTALVVIDMQRDFLAPGGALADGDDRSAASLASVVDRAARVLRTARRTHLAVIHTREGYAADGRDINPYKRFLGYVGRPGPTGPFLIRGTPGHDFFEGFEPVRGERVIDKAAFSAFYDTPLEHTLERRGVTHLVIMGVTTQCCVHSTLRDAVERGYFCLTLEDCCAAEDADVHAAALRIIQAENHLFGWIASADDFIDAIEDV